MGGFAAKARCSIIHGLDTPVLEARSLKIGYKYNRKREQVVAENLNLRILPGEFICLIGPNGVGKSTLLKTLTRLLPPLDGEILSEGKNLQAFSNRELAHLISVVLTLPVQVGAMRVYNLVGMGRISYTGLFDQFKERDSMAVNKAIRMVDADHLRDRYIHELSDGERQKIMIARALAQEPSLLILDEPTAFLDLPGRVSVMQLLRSLAADHQKAVLTSTHDLDLALHSADRIWLMEKNGDILQGAPEDLVLSGSFGNTFSRVNAVFDVNTGKFDMNALPQKRIVLKGDGLTRIWTERALQRSGFEVLTGGLGKDLTVEASEQDGKPVWTLYRSGSQSIHTSIYSLLLALSE